MITTLLVDDEPRATDRLATLLAAHPAVDVIGTARDVGDAERLMAGPRLLPSGARVLAWVEVESPRRGRLFGTDWELARLDAGRTAGVTTPVLLP